MYGQPGMMMPGGVPRRRMMPPMGAMQQQQQHLAGGAGILPPAAGGAPGGPVGPGQAMPPPATEEERAIRRMQERQQITGQGFELLSRVLQLGAMLASSGHQLLSVAVGTSFAVRAFRSLASGQPLPPMMGGPEGGGMLGMGGNGPLAPGPSSAAGASGAVAQKPAAPGRISSLLGRIGSSPAAMVAIVAFALVADHLIKRWKLRRERQALEEEERLLGLEQDQHADFDAIAATSADDTRGDANQIVPSASAVERTYVARFEFTAEAANQLSLAPGDQLVIDEYNPDGWCWARTSGATRSSPIVAQAQGYIPGNYVERVVGMKRRL